MHHKFLVMTGGILLLSGMACGSPVVSQAPILTGTNIAQANVGTDGKISTDEETIKDGIIELPQGRTVYPVVHLKNPKAMEEINRDIKLHVDKFVNDVKSKETFIKSAGIGYDVQANNDEYISIVLKSMVFARGSAHPAYFYEGLVYDKKTGKRQMIDSYMHLTKEAIVHQAKTQLYIYRQIDKEPQKYNPSFSYIKQINNFFLDSHGNLFVLFQPGDMAMSAAGVTCVKFTNS